MNEYHIYGLSRSGNHAIIFWLIHNIVDSIQEIGHSIYVDQNQILCYINNVNIQNKFNSFIFPINNFQYILKSYEDIYFTEDTTVIVLRDFLNLLSSRYKKYHNYKDNICLNNNYICDLNYLITTWKQHCRSPKRTILYNQWLLSKDYRNKVSRDILKIDNINDKIEYIPNIGQGSSFESKDYLKRYSDIKLPNHMIQTILSDNELLDLNKTIFNMDIKTIVENYAS